MKDHGLECWHIIRRHSIMAQHDAQRAGASVSWWWNNAAPRRYTWDSPMMNDLARLVAIEDIKQLKARYYRLLDTHDWEGFRSLWTPDAIMDVNFPDRILTSEDGIYRGPDAITAFAITFSLGLYYPALLAGLIFCALSVAASRVILGLHYLSDVLIGIVIGTTIGIGIFVRLGL